MLSYRITEQKDSNGWSLTTTVNGVLSTMSVVNALIDECVTRNRRRKASNDCEIQTNLASRVRRSRMAYMYHAAAPGPRPGLALTLSLTPSWRLRR